MRQTLRLGKRRRLEHLDVIWIDNTAGYPRLGLIVPKHRTTAVARNRLRRRLREVWRRDLQSHLPAWDTVVRARREAYTASLADLRNQLLAWQAGIPR